MPQVIGIPKETYPDEKRVATSPEVVTKLIGLGFAVTVESGAGDAASFYDGAYAAAGAKIAAPPPKSGRAPTSSSRCARLRAQRSR